MADGTTLVLVFENTEGNTEVFVYPFANPSVTSAQVKTLMDAIIANQEIMAGYPDRKVRAYTVTTSENEIDVS